MSEMVYFQIFHDMEELLEAYDDAQRGRILTAMMQYAFHGEDVAFNGVERFVWPAIRQRIDQSAQKLDKLRANGAKGGKSTAKQTEANSSKPKQTEANSSKPEHIKEQEQEQEKDKDKEQEQRESKAAKARFAPPTAAQVEAFCTENKIRSVDAKRFVDFYASKGWKVGNTPMKDWHAAVRNWAGRDSTQQYSRIGKGACHEYTQRNYTEADLAFGIQDLLKESEKYNDPEYDAS